MKTMLKTLVGMALIAGACLSTPALAQENKDDKKDTGPKSVAEVSPGDKIIYQIDLYGQLGRDVHEVPIRKALADARQWNPDYLVFRVNMGYSAGGSSLGDWFAGVQLDRNAFNLMETVRELQTMFTDGIRDDPEWKTRDGKKPELVMWVKSAMGGAAFFPFTAPTVFFTSDAHHGGIGYLELALAGRGDFVVQQKMYAIRLGRAVGLAIKGGHDEHIIKAMARLDYVLSVSYVGGKPVFYEDMTTGEELLTDDGDPDAGRADTIEQALRFEGNDVLVIDAAKALKLGFAKAVVDSQEDLANELGCARNYVLIKGRGDGPIRAWVREVTRAEGEMRDTLAKMRRVDMGGQTLEERNRARATMIRHLREIIERWERYGTAINGQNVRGVPPANECEVRIEQLKQEMRLDR